MIVENNNKWIICTPAKTGSYSLENTLIKGLGVAHKLEANNRVDCQYNGKIKRRILIVRHPLERWSSMFWFARQKNFAGRSIFGSAEAGLTLPKTACRSYAMEWLRAWSVQEHPNFTRTFSEMKSIFGASQTWQIENLQGLLYDLGYMVDIKHSNKGQYVHSWKSTSKLLDKFQREKIISIYQQDLKQFHYDH